MSGFGRAWTLFGALAASVTACAPPVQVGFDSADPQGRTIALARAAKAGDPEAIPEMITMLNSVDPAQRMLAIRALERQTGQTFGYRYYAEEAERVEAQERWRRWWAEQGPERRS